MDRVGQAHYNDMNRDNRNYNRLIDCPSSSNLSAPMVSNKKHSEQSQVYTHIFSLQSLFTSYSPSVACSEIAEGTNNVTVS